MIFDSHAHYDDESYNSDRENLIEEIKNNNVIGVLNCGASLEGARKSVLLTKKYDFFYAAVGIHPEFANIVSNKVIDELEKLCKNRNVVAIGEIGLDYHYEEDLDKDVQKKAFIKQMELAQKLGLPVVIHDRDAHQDTLNIIKMFPEVKGVFHCFSGSTVFAAECIKLGYYIGFTGVLTFKNAKKLVEVAKMVPENRFLLETDCQYMSPEPYRGKRNRSDYISFVSAKMAEIRGLTQVEIEEHSINNIKRLLKID